MSAQQEQAPKVLDATTAFGNPTTKTAIEAHVKAVRSEKSRAAFARVADAYMTKRLVLGLSRHPYE